MVAHPDDSSVRIASAAARSFLKFWRLLFSGRIYQPREHLGGLLNFADGSCAHVFREIRVDHPPSREPVLLVVEFRLRFIHGRAHRLFERMSTVLTPLFAGIPGFVSKLWLAHDENEVYRAIYEWDGADSAGEYARMLRRVLSMASQPGSVCYQILPGTTRAQYVAGSEELVEDIDPINLESWWRVS